MEIEPRQTSRRGGLQSSRQAPPGLGEHGCGKISPFGRPIQNAAIAVARSQLRERGLFPIGDPPQQVDDQSSDRSRLWPRGSNAGGQLVGNERQSSRFDRGVELGHPLGKGKVAWQEHRAGSRFRNDRSKSPQDDGPASRQGLQIDAGTPASRGGLDSPQPLLEQAIAGGMSNITAPQPVLQIQEGAKPAFFVCGGARVSWQRRNDGRLSDGGMRDRREQSDLLPHGSSRFGNDGHSPGASTFHGLILRRIAVKARMERRRDLPTNELRPAAPLCDPSELIAENGQLWQQDFEGGHIGPLQSGPADIQPT